MKVAIVEVPPETASLAIEVLAAAGVKVLATVASDAGGLLRFAISHDKLPPACECGLGLPIPFVRMAVRAIEAGDGRKHELAGFDLTNGRWALTINALHASFEVIATMTTAQEPPAPSPKRRLVGVWRRIAAAAPAL